MSESSGEDTKQPVKNREWIAELLDRVPVVEWDRFVVAERGDNQIVEVYGWIDREKDEYKDFVWTRFWPEQETMEYTTSSDQYTEYLCEEWFGDTGEHNPCRRVEHAFDVENAIELTEESSLQEFATDGGQAVYRCRFCTEEIASSDGEPSDPCPSCDKRGWYVLVTDGGRPSEAEMLDVELVLGAGRLDDHQVRLDVTTATVVDREEGRLEISLAGGGMDEYLAELGLKNRTDEFATDGGRETAGTQQDEHTIEVDAETYGRFEEAREETKNVHVPAMDQSTFMDSLLDTLQAVKEGHYNDD